MDPTYVNPKNLVHRSDSVAFAGLVFLAGVMPRDGEADGIAAQARAIRAQAVLTHAMPPNNLSGITPEERQVLARWLAGNRS